MGIAVTAVRSARTQNGCGRTDRHVGKGNGREAEAGRKAGQARGRSAGPRREGDDRTNRYFMAL